jgi:antibiotic biosynthesis monooxygenase (ABM) superfamily enzyme
MDNRKQQKKEPWRIVVAIAAVVYIVFLWVRKDIAAIYSGMPMDQALPLIATTVAVSLVKVAAIAAVVFLVKWLTGKFRQDQE